MSDDEGSNQPQFDIDELWKEFFPKLKSVVMRRVRAIKRSAASESEIALSAFNSFVDGVNAGQFPALSDREEMWKLVRTIAIRKANDARKRLRAQKRGGDLSIAGQADADDSRGPTGVNQAPAAVDAPDFALEVSDFFNHMLDQLPDDRHRDVILLRLQGASVVTIAECLSTTTRTVQRTLKKIEDEWTSAVYSP